ncbi:6687_t:CDS:2 [Funneliformis mosseae]|uniref:6687_t:CDS:1 n=1 Tax=Funneliformis mosseae TaxID=27381 RepID=A0A9N9I2P0_FUNMO|nr:6687_t:CDS:2 [Funneliformis mosseae]
MSKNSPVISHPHEELMNLEDASDLSVSESKTPKPEVENNLESFAKNLDFVGPDFIWLTKMTENDHLEIFEFIVDPEWEDVATEITTNALAYHRLVKSGAFEDKPKGSYVLIVYGEVLKYYEKDVSSEDYEQLEKKYPGKYFAPITRKTFLLRRFSAIASATRNEW